MKRFSKPSQELRFAARKSNLRFDSLTILNKKRKDTGNNEHAQKGIENERRSIFI